MGSARGVLLFSLALLSAPALGAEPASGLRVGRITIRTQNVFSEVEAKSGKLYRALDRARVKTRPSVIAKFLLFHEGEPYDEEKLRATERNLRELGFLKAAKVTAREPRNGRVDVDVETQDSWTLVPGVPLASAGGTTTYGLQLLERDLLGTGRELSISYNKEVERITRVVEFIDPTLFGPYWEGRFSFGHNSDGNRVRASVIHPFTTLTALESHEARLDVFSQTTRTYDAG
ncbi:MAG TPA: POTRA domain-containing protein, partial [Thermoanaerobaculia bacterium]|nr:POTRA domain-containing protein [Thermoanaerobaculia bacterium]